MSEILIDAIFDLIAAVGYPIAVLAYSYTTFDFDDAAFQVTVDVPPTGSFELLARAAADPAEIAFFLACFDSLRFLSLGNLALRLCMNLSFCNRLRAVVASLLSQRLRARVKHSAVTCSNPPGLGQSTAASTVVAPLPQRPVPRLTAALFLAYAAGVLAFSETAMTHSLSACTGYPQCVVFAHRLQPNGPASCPCLTLIDADQYPRTYDEWMHPIDDTEVVEELARSGDLRVLQIINRGLPRWPDSLRRCRQLHYISLIYTGLEEIPSWARELRMLEYLHIEGKELFPNLQHIDSDLFTDMPHLTFLHLAVHDQLRVLPPLTGVPNLRSVVFAHMFSLEKAPSLEHVPLLQRLEFHYVPVLKALPDLTPLRHLVHLTVFRRSQLCCNGFLGDCDLKALACTADTARGFPAATCQGPEDPQPSGETLALVREFSFSVCQPSKFDLAHAVEALAFDTITPCGGVLFRRCESPWLSAEGERATGICYNNRMQVLSCVTNPDLIRLREAQIARGVGLPCDDIEEAWLGCGGTASS